MVLGLAAAALLLLLLSAGRADAQELRVTEAVGEVLAPTTPPAEAAAPVVDSVVKPVVDPVVSPVVDPVVKPVVDPVVSPVVDPVVKPVVDPVVDPVVKPVVDPVVKPVVDPVVKPVTSPTDASTKPTPAARDAGARLDNGRDFRSSKWQRRNAPCKWHTALGSDCEISCLRRRAGERRGGNRAERRGGAATAERHLARLAH